MSVANMSDLGLEKLSCLLWWTLRCQPRWAEYDKNAITGYLRCLAYI